MHSVPSYGQYVIVLPPLPSWGGHRLLASVPRGRGRPSLPWEATDPRTSCISPEDVIVQIMHSPLIITLLTLHSLRDNTEDWRRPMTLPPGPNSSAVTHIQWTRGRMTSPTRQGRE